MTKLTLSKHGKPSTLVDLLIFFLFFFFISFHALKIPNFLILQLQNKLFCLPFHSSPKKGHLPDTQLEWYAIKQFSFECMHSARKQRNKASHLGSLDVSHVIPQQLCELQLLVRCNSSLHFLQGTQTETGCHNLFTNEDKY